MSTPKPEAVNRAGCLNARFFRTFGLAILVLLVGSTLASAQALTLNTSTGGVFIPIAASDYDPATGSAATILTAGNTFALKSTSSSWTLSVRAQTSTFSFAPSLGDANPNKPCSELSIRASSLGPWLALSTGSQFVTSGPKQNLNAPPKQIPIDYQVLSTLQNDPPGTYSITLIWTLTNP